MTTTEHVDAVVVGSGFGGSVAAYRLAMADQRVVVLERGQAYAPGSFPRSPEEMSRAFWDPGAGLHGLFDVWTFRGFDSIVSSGLGGGSLIYANVLLRKDEKWFVHEDPVPGGGYETWPVTREDLEPHYDAVEKMLAPQRYPFDEPAYANTPKTHAMQQAAKNLGLEWQLPPLGVSFAPEPDATPAIGLPIVEPAYGNLHGVARRTCRLCGECDIGCNDGAKNTLDHNFLSAATSGVVTAPTSAPAARSSRCGCAMAAATRSPTSSTTRHARVRARIWASCRHARSPATAWSWPPARTARRTCCCATEAACRASARHSARGSRGNGDLLAFLLPGEKKRSLDPSRGPVITSAIRVDDAKDGGYGRGFYIEDGGYPGFANWLVESADLAGLLFRAAEFVTRWALTLLRQWPDNRLGHEISRLIGKGALSAGSLPLLGMGRDVPDGVMRLNDDLLDIDWTTETSAVYFDRIRETMRQIADELDTRYADNPLWSFQRVITVHPLGGAPMGRHIGEGVCDEYGEVFGLPGLYIADGAAMPGPVGANPSLTIAAMADRMSTRLLKG